VGISAKLKDKIKAMSEEDRDRLVRMGWEDRSTFDAIEAQFGLTPNDFVRFMRTQLDRKTYDRWRKRANSQGHLKHQEKRGFKTSQFKSSRQSLEGKLKGYK
jgi:uncharacterized protein (TIGR03643 family)